MNRPVPRTLTLPYRHTQPGYVSAVGFLLGFLGIGCAWRACSADRRPGWIFPVMGVVLLGAGLTFGALTVEVTGRALSFRFGLGLPRRTIELRTIRNARIVRNPWYYGWGIHLSLDGWIYNVSGTWAVRLECKRRRLRWGPTSPPACWRPSSWAGRRGSDQAVLPPTARSDRLRLRRILHSKVGTPSLSRSGLGIGTAATPSVPQRSDTSRQG